MGALHRSSFRCYRCRFGLKWCYLDTSSCENCSGRVYYFKCSRCDGSITFSPSELQCARRKYRGYLKLMYLRELQADVEDMFQD